MTQTNRSQKPTSASASYVETYSWECPESPAANAKMTKKLITKSAALLEDRGFTQSTSAHDRQREGGGITHTVFDHDETGKRFYVRAKQDVYKNLAPFGKGMVEHAVEDNVMLCIYFDDRGQFFVFDPHYVAKHGVEETNHSKFDDEPRTWLELTLEHGCRLSAYVDGRATPDEPSDKRHNRSLEDFA